MSWFFRIFGFEEFAQGMKHGAFENVRRQLSILTTGDSHILTNLQGTKFWVGRYTQQSLLSLREELGPKLSSTGGSLVVGQVEGNVAKLHADPELAGSVFQVASQFNVLEMVSPDVGPDAGITGYVHDRTQGPACAMSCPAATVFRNYFVNVTGQDTPEHQIDGLKEAHALLLGMQKDAGVEQPVERLWRMQNGYCMPESQRALQITNALLDPSSAGGQQRRRSFINSITFGTHWDTQVGGSVPPGTALQDCHKVAQIFCSALPVAYNDFPTNDWTHFATAVLQSAYEATFAVAANLSKQRGDARVAVYLTRLGGGVFGNSDNWIKDAIEAACVEYQSWPIDVMHVKFRP